MEGEAMEVSSSSSSSTNKKRNVLNFQSFPDEIKMEILCKLPTESLVKYKSVCKNWLALISHASFSDMHLQHSLRLDEDEIGDRVSMVLLVCRYENDKVLYHVVYDHYDDVDDPTLTISKINHPSIDLGCRLIGSCNGLICFVQYSGRTNYQGIGDPIYIYNPITREFVNLPRFDDHLSPQQQEEEEEEEEEEDPLVDMFSGFGYHRCANVYKVVRICYLKDQPSIGRVQVYTLGSGSGWRNIGEVKYNLQHNVHDNSGVLVNGALHWVSDGYIIVRFDLAKEEFCLLPSPPCFLVDDENNTFVLKELEGCLCVVHKKKGEFVQVWSFEKKMNKSSCLDIKGQEFQSGSWSKTITITIKVDDDDDDDDYVPFAVMKGGKVLMWYDETVLCAFDPKTKSFKQIDLEDEGKNFWTVIHMNSFVSLKSLGEDAKIIGSVDEAEPCILP